MSNAEHIKGAMAESSWRHERAAVDANHRKGNIAMLI